MIRFKKFTILLVSFLVFSMLISTNVLASSLEIKDIEENYLTEDIEYEIQPMGAGPVLVFFAGIFVGYIIDGVLIKTTGLSGGEWVAKALSYHSKNKGCTNIQVTSGGHTYCGGGRSF